MLFLIRWSSIAAKLPGRTDNEIKNFWHTHLKKKLQRSSNTTTTTSSGLLSKFYAINTSTSMNNNFKRISQSISTSTTGMVVAAAVQSHPVMSHVEEPYYSSITNKELEATAHTVVLSPKNINDHDHGKYFLPKTKYSSATTLFDPKFQISLNSESTMDQYSMNKSSSNYENNGLTSKNIVDEDMDFWYNLFVKAGESTTPRPVGDFGCNTLRLE